VSVAASSFDMKITDPKPLLDELDLNRLNHLLRPNSKKSVKRGPTYEEPSSSVSTSNDTASVSKPQETSSNSTVAAPPTEDASQPLESTDIIRGRVQKLGDFIDTDAVSHHPVYVLQAPLTLPS